MTAEPPFEAPHPADVEDALMPIPALEEPTAPEPRRKPEGVKPPHSLEAEREVLSALFIDNATATTVADALEPQDFYFERHQLVFAAILGLQGKDVAIDIVTVMQALKDRGQYEKIGGARALGELLDRSGTVTNLAHYIAIVRDKARVRDVLDTVRSIETQALQDIDDVDAFVEAARARTAAAMERVAKAAEPMRLQSIAERVKDGEPNWLEETPPDVSVLMRTPEGAPYMLNSRVGVIEAGGGTGKSWLVLQLAVAVASGGKWLETYGCQKGRVGVFLGEEKDEEIWRRVWRVCKHLKLSEYERSEVARNLVPLGLDGDDVAFLHKTPDGNIVPTPYFARLQQALKEHCWKLLIFDPLSYFGGPEVENDPHTATTLIRCGSRLTRSPGEPAVLFSAHSRKKQQGVETKLDAGNARGSSAIVDGARWVLSMAKRSETIIAMKVTKTNYTVGGDELLMARSTGGVLRPATPGEIAEDIAARKEARKVKP